MKGTLASPWRTVMDDDSTSFFYPLIFAGGRDDFEISPIVKVP